MATIIAQATGNWSAPGTWAGGVLPGAGGANDNADSNGYTVTIDQDINLNGGALIGTSAGAGGFTVATARAITANVTATVRTVLTDSHTTGMVSITGAVTGGGSIGAIGVNRTGTGALTITGAITGGSSTTAYGLFTSQSGTITVTGTITGGSGNAAYGIGTSNATITVTGDVVGGSHSAGRGINNGSGGSVTVVGAATGGPAGVGAYNESSGSLTVTEAIGNGYGPGSAVANSVPGVYGSATAGASTRVYRATSGAYGQYPVAGAVKIVSDATNKHTWRDPLPRGLAYPFASYPSLLTDLVAYWALNGDGTDATGRGNDLTNSGASWAAGLIGQAADLERLESDYLYRADNADLSMDGTSFSVSAWCKPESMPAAMYVASKDASAANREWHVAVLATGEAFIGLPLVPAYVSVSTPAGVVSAGGWFHIVATVDIATKTITIRVNDGTVYSNTYTSDFGATLADFSVGTRQGDVNKFDGLIGPVAIWKRVLSAAEITALYNAAPDIELVP